MRFLRRLKAASAPGRNAAGAASRRAELIAYHNTWPYFARRFRLNIVDVIEAKEGVAPSAGTADKLAALDPRDGRCASSCTSRSSRWRPRAIACRADRRAVVQARPVGRRRARSQGRARTVRPQCRALAQALSSAIG